MENEVMYKNIERFYEENKDALFSEALRPKKTFAKDPSHIQPICDYVKKNKSQEITQETIKECLNVQNLNSTNDDIHLLQDFGFITEIKAGSYKIEEKFRLFLNLDLPVQTYLLHLLLSIKSVENVTSYLNLLVCSLREGYLYGTIIDMEKGNKGFAELEKVRQQELFSRVERAYGYAPPDRGDSDTPHVFQRARGGVSALGLVSKLDEKTDEGYGLYQVTEYGHNLLRAIDSNLARFYGLQANIPQPSTEKIVCIGTLEDVVEKLPKDGLKKEVEISSVSTYDELEAGLNKDVYSVERDETTIKLKKIGINKNRKPIQQIVYGAPGTGKSHSVNDITCNDAVCNFGVTLVDSGEKDASEKVIMCVPKSMIFRTTFHPDYDYAQFVGCYKPLEKESGKITYSFEAQTFIDAYVQAWQDLDKPVYLVIEEINRGNCASIFGDIFQLLDRKNGFSEYPIAADSDLKKYLTDTFNKNFDPIAAKFFPNVKNGAELVLPSNLNIIATMNTSDQSLFPMDSAFKRRWVWKYERIKYRNSFMLDAKCGKISWPVFQKAVNSKILDLTKSEDKQMGDYFVTESMNSESLFVDKVMFYLWSDICKDRYKTRFSFFKRAKDINSEETEDFSFSELSNEAAQKDVLKEFLNYLKMAQNQQGEWTIQK